MLIKRLAAVAVLLAFVIETALGAPTTESAPSGKENLDNLFKAIEESDRVLPRETFDPAAVRAKVGGDPAALFRWVRDETSLVPYRGALRGPVGVLMDRVGNSLDRALLLAELLRLAGHTVRLAHGELTADRADQVLRKLRPPPKGSAPASQSPSAAQLDGMAAQAAARYQADRAAFRHGLDVALSKSVETRRQLEEAVRRSERQSMQIAAAVGPAVAGKGASSGSAALLREHWWVQRQNGAAWTDLDPSLPDASPGAALAPVRETVAADKLDPNLWHRIQIRFVIERWEAGALKEEAVLTHVWRPADTIGQPVFLRHSPLKWPKDLQLARQADPARKLREAMLAQDQWMPILGAGPSVINKMSFTEAGQVSEATASSATAGAFGAMGGVLGSIGEEKKESYLTAEWIEFQVLAPGVEVRPRRRAVFDLIGPAGRASSKAAKPQITEAKRLERSAALLTQIDVLPLVCQPSQPFVAHLSQMGMLARRGLLPAFRAAQASAGNAEPFLEGLGQMVQPPSYLYLLALVRQEANRGGQGLYIAAPNVLTYQTRIGLDAAGGDVTVRRGFDIIANDMSVRPGGSVDPFLARLQQGAWDTNAEALLASSPCAPAENTANLFERSRGEGTRWLFVRGHGGLLPADLEISTDVRMRAEEDLAAGYSLLLPDRPEGVSGTDRFGWWRINTSTGETLGMMETGMGQGLTEYGTLLGKIVLLGEATFFFSYIGCAGKEAIMDSKKQKSGKGQACFFCALYSTWCVEMMFLSAMDPLFLQYNCGLWDGFAGIVACGSVSGFMNY